MRRTTHILIFLLLLGRAVQAPAQTQSSLEGTVRDASGAVITSATVTLQIGAFHATASTDDRGHFAFASVPPGSGSLEVSAQGFLAAQKSWTVAAPAHLDITLEPSSTKEDVVVSAARAELRLSETPESTVVLDSEDLNASPADRIDDVLREVPGFSLYRRSSSRTANPSTQGVSLRGLGGSATSRALVLADGISLVDPFGGWVYWDRVPRTAISDIEVVRGGASNLYGSDAMAGVIQLLMRQPEAPAFSLETAWGNEDSPELSLWTGNRMGQWNYSASTEMFRTHGFYLVPVPIRGAIDTKADVEDATVLARIGRDLRGNGKLFLRGNYFTEYRHNGTTIQTNDTTLGEGGLGIDQPLGKNDSLSFRFYGDVETYHQSYSSIKSINHSRDTETLTDSQHVPEQIVGGGAQWTHLLGKSQTIIAGMDMNEVIGASVDDFFNNATNQAQIGSGRQRALGWFGEDIFQRAKWTVIAAARVDDWSNFEGQTFVVPISGPPTLTQYSDRSKLAFNPRLSVLRALNQNVSITGSIYRAFRAPTLNELYRPFRVGAIETLNNPMLTAERLTGAEAGMNVAGWNRRLNIRGTFFWSDIVDPVESVTIGNNLEQKENLGRTRSRGVELEGLLRVTSNFQFTAGYVYTEATVLSYPGNPGGNDLVGLDVPQVPRNGLTWEARYWNASRIFASVQARFVGRQFDDDLNTLPLDRFYTMNFEIGRQIHHNAEIFVAAENFTNQRYQVARTPTVNVGPPILARVGLRLNFPTERK